jgi:hypothetical protein
MRVSRKWRRKIGRMIRRGVLTKAEGKWAYHVCRMLLLTTKVK